MQPAQLSLLPKLTPPPVPLVLAELPEEEVREAVRLLAALIAKTSKSAIAPTTPEAKEGADE